MALLDQATAFWRLGDPITSNKFIDNLGNGNDLYPNLRPTPVSLDFRMGSNNFPTQHLYGALSKWGKWNRILTPTEKFALHGGEVWPFGTTQTLKDAVAFFHLNEATGSSIYADATGRGNNLMKQGTPTQTTGPFGGSDLATLFAGPNISGPGDSLWRPITVDLQTGNIPWTICGWVNLTAINPPTPITQQIFWGQWDTSGTTSGTNLYFDPTAGAATFCVDQGFPNNLGQGPAITNTTLNPSAGTWYFVLAEYDPVTNMLSHTINNDAFFRVHLSPIQQPVASPGKIGYASDFQINPAFSFGTLSGWDAPPPVDGSCYLYMPRNNNVSFGNNSFTVWGWYRCTLPSPWPPQTLIGIYDPGATRLEWSVRLTNGILNWDLGDGGSAGETRVHGVPIDNAWHLFVCWFDAVNREINVVIDNGPVPLPTSLTTKPHIPGTMYGSPNLTIGAASRLLGGSAEQFTGQLNAIGIARGIPTTGDLATLWNSGNGIVLGNAPSPKTSCSQ
jgi:hypothetical protein